MITKNFYFDFNVKGTERKRLVEAISNYTGADSKYLGAPTFAYEVDRYTVDKDGTVWFDDRGDSEENESLLETLANEGFVSQDSNLGCEEETEFEEAEIEDADESAPSEDSDTTAFTFEMPKNDFTDAALENLHKLVDSKAELIKKALGVNELKIVISEDRITFPWFNEVPDADEVKAYTHFITALCEMAKNQKRITAKEKPVDNEKYAFRCFLLRLGFIGKEYKTERKILLKNFTGSSAFKNGGTSK